MERLFEIVRANPMQFLAIGALVAVVILAWAIESSAWRTRHH